VSDHEFEEEEFTSEFNGKTVLRILAQARPHWKMLLGFLISIAAVSLIDSYLTFLSKRIIDEGILLKDAAILKEIVTQYGLLIIFQALGVFGFIYAAGILGERIQYDLRRKTFNHLQKLSLAYFDKTPVGWIFSRVTSDSTRISELITWGLLDITWATMSISSALYFMFRINASLALIVLIIVPVLVIVGVQFKKRIILEYRKVRKMNSKITGSYNEMITGVRVGKALVREKKSLDEFGTLSNEMHDSSFKAAWLSALFLPAVQLISAFAVGGVVLFGGIQAQAGALSIGGIQAFVSYITFMMWPIQDLARVYAEMQQSIASAERVFSLIDSVPEISDRPYATDPGTIKGDLEFRNVTFYYEADKPILQNFNLKVQRGETIALVGPTGGGKSTIVNLLSRFYEPKAGSIQIGGRDYTDFALHAIHSRLGIVLQTPHLFSGSVMENIRYGRLQATDEDVISAAKLAGANGFITEFEKGFNQDVGEGGGLLSVGQKQLISLARAILAQPEIFIMDEATSSVDTITEALIQAAMETLMQDRTSFIIAHRLSTIKKADRILVIRDGGVQEFGTHAELIALKGHYYNLYTQQFRREYEEEHRSLAFGLETG
jgi:ATP-binding cassette, subfamily B, bacterial